MLALAFVFAFTSPQTEIMVEMLEMIYACEVMSPFSLFTFVLFTNGLVSTLCRCLLLETIFPLNAAPKLKEMGHNHINAKYLFVEFTKKAMSLSPRHAT